MMKQSAGIQIQLWLSFLLVLLAGMLGMNWLDVRPRGMDEIGAGAGCVALIIWLFWILMFVLTLSFSLSIKRRPPPPGRGWITVVLFWIVSIAISGFLSFDWFRLKYGDGFTGMEQRASTWLRTVATAEADFRANDRDGNKIQDYWVGDVAGLYTATPPGSKDMIKLIEASCALQDANPLPESVKGWADWNGVDRNASSRGYVVQALQSYVSDDGKTQPYSTGSHRNGKCFGFSSYPLRPGAGRKTFIVNEHNQVWWKNLEGATLDTFPADPAKQGWRRVDY